jgi:hypothetical protein
MPTAREPCRRRRGLAVGGRAHGATAEAVGQLLRGCRRTAVGRRDYAVILLLSRLGLRAIEASPSRWTISAGRPGRS